MKYIFQSLRYLKPYRVRLIVSFVLVLCIAVLWGGGLSMLLPGMKVLISDEGLHGWAWNSMTQGRLNATIVNRLGTVRDTSGQALDVGFGGALRDSVFNVVTLASSGGFGNARGPDSLGNFVLWKASLQIMLLLLMVVEERLVFCS